MAFPLIFGQSSKFSALVRELDRAAMTPWPMLLLGETGVGKELLARRIHDSSPRKLYAFVPVNCGAIVPGIFESELFGHERGAFSGATQSCRGLVRSAHKGTLFLDEVGDLSPDLQVKLLRFLDSGEVRSVGGNRFEKTDVRIVAATNCDLHLAVSEGLFRQDLLERLAVFQFSVPPLRERMEDLEMIAREILDSLSVRYEASLFNELKKFHWPGNVRQLKNVLIRASLTEEPKVNASTIAPILDEQARLSFSAESGEKGINLSLADIERQVILERLKKCRGNRKLAAKELGIAKSTLHEKLKKWKGSDAGLRAPAAHFQSFET
jgi:transcriptional regulator with PAS, ATPase and Fis domain